MSGRLFSQLHSIEISMAAVFTAAYVKDPAVPFKTDPFSMLII